MIILRNKANILWGLFISIILLSPVYFFQNIKGSATASALDFSRPNVFGGIILLLAMSLLILHAVWVLGTFRGVTFLTLSFMTGLASELLGINFGAIFGGYYVYNPAMQPAIFDVPLLIPIIWAYFIYGGYSIVSSYLIWLRNSWARRNQNGLLYKMSLPVLTAFAVLSVDLVMEPLLVKNSNWRWLESGAYFDIPIGNFLGWFFVVVISVFLFLIIQDHLPQKHDTIDKRVMLIPVLGYGLLGIICVFLSLQADMVPPGLIGLLTIFPALAVNLVLFLRWKYSL